LAEIELVILITQCTGRRIPDTETLTEEVSVWEEARNAAGTGVNWRFTTEDACIKLNHLYLIWRIKTHQRPSRSMSSRADNRLEDIGMGK
jgi:REP element-mobilizing transposase RayT